MATIEAIFAKLDAVMQNISLDSSSLLIAIADKDFNNNCETLMQFVDPDEFSLVIQGFCDIVTKYESFYKCLIVVPAKLREYLNQLRTHYGNDLSSLKFSNSLIDIVISTMIKCSTCFELRAVFSILLNLNLDEKRIITDSACFQLYNSLNEKILLDIVKFLCDVNPMSVYQNTYKSWKSVLATSSLMELPKLHSRPPPLSTSSAENEESDMLFAILNSKEVYGKLAFMEYCVTKNETLQYQMDTVFDFVFKHYRSCPILVQAFCYFNVQSILRYWSSGKLESTTFLHAKSDKIFETMYVVCNDHKSYKNVSSLALTYKFLMICIVFNESVFSKFEQYLKKDKMSFAHSGLSNCEVKMLSILLKLVGQDSDMNAFEKHIILQCFDVLLIAAVAFKKLDAKHPVVVFCEQNFLRIYEKLHDILFSLSSSVMENVLLEDVKVNVMYNCLILQPQKFLKLHLYNLRNYYSIDRYAFFITLSCLVKFSKNCEHGTPLWNSVNNETMVDLMKSICTPICEMMKVTKPQFSKVMHFLNPRASVVLQGFTYNEFDQAQDQITQELAANAILDYGVDYGHILSDSSYLVRKTFVELIRWLRLAANELVFHDSLFVSNAELFSMDAQQFDERLDSLFQRGFARNVVLLQGLEDEHFSCFYGADLQYTSFLCFDSVTSEYCYSAFAVNIRFLVLRMNQLISGIQNGQVNASQVHGFLNVTKYLCMLMEHCIPRVDYTKIFDNLQSKRVESYLEFARTCEKCIFVFLAVANVELFLEIRKFAGNFVKFTESNDAQINTLVKEALNWPMLCAIAKDNEVIIYSQRFLQKKITYVLHNHLDDQTAMFQEARLVVWKVFEKFMSSLELRTSKEGASSFASCTTFLSIALSAGLTLDPYDTLKSMEEKSTRNTFIDYIIKLFYSSELSDSVLAEDIVASYMDERLLMPTLLRIFQEFEKISSLSNDRLLKIPEYKKFHIFVAVFDRTLHRVDDLVKYQLSSIFIKASNVIKLILMSQLFHLRKTAVSAKISSVMNEAVHMNVYKIMKDMGSDDDPKIELSSDTAQIVNHFIRVRCSSIRYGNLVFKNMRVLCCHGTHALWKNEFFQIYLRMFEFAFFINNSRTFLKIILSSDDPNRESLAAKTAHNMKDFNFDCLQGLKYLSDNLQIFISNINFEEELSSLRNMQFNMSFNILTRILKKALSDLAAHPGTNPSDLISEFHTNCHFTRGELTRIADETKQVLANFVRANFDIGSPYIVNMMTDSSPLLHSVFLEIFRALFHNDTQRLSIKTKIDDVEFREFFATASIQPDFLVAARNLVTSSEFESMSIALVRISVNFDHLVETVKALIDYELLVCLKPLDILRRNNLTTKVLSSIGKLYGTDYLKKTVGVVLDQIILNEDYFEVDQFYQGTNETISNEDSGRFFHYFTLLVNRISDSAEDLPPQMRATCHCLYARVYSKTKDRELSSIIVSTFFFLRFLCPAIAYPSELDLLDYEPNAEAKRCFVLLTKALQNASNGTLNIEKFPLLKGKEIEMQSLVNKISKFVKEISSDPVKESMRYLAKRHFEVEDARVVYTFTIHHCEDLRDFLRLPKFNSQHSIEQQADMFRQMGDYFDTLGCENMVYYPEVASMLKDNKNKYIETYDLVQKALLDPKFPEVIKDKVFSESIAKDGTSVFTITYSYASFDKDPKLLFARLMQTLYRKSTTSFYFVMDCTLHNDPSMFTSLTEVFKLLCLHTPIDLAASCAGVYYLNVSSAFSERLTKVLAERSDSEDRFLHPKHTKHTFLSSFDDKKVIDSLNITKWHHSVTSGGLEFQDVELLAPIASTAQNDETKVMASTGKKVKIKIMNRFIMYETGENKKAKVGNFNRAVKVVNVEPLPNWENLKEFRQGNKTFFRVYSRLLGKTLVFSGSNTQEIVSSYYLNFSSYSISVYNESRKLLMAEKPIRSEELLGEALIAIGIGLVSDDGAVRRNAYELLYTAKSEFKFDNERPMPLLGPSFVPPKSYEEMIAISKLASKCRLDITKDVVNAFIYISNQNADLLNSEYCHKLFMVMSPWFSLVGDQVSGNENIRGWEITQSFLAAVVKLIPEGQIDMAEFNYRVWKPLVAQQFYSKMLVDETVKEMMNRKFAGKDYGNIVALMAANPAIQLAGETVEQLVSSMKLGRSILGQDARIQLFWRKIEVLLEMLVSLCFHRVSFVEQFFPELLFICSIYHRTGTKPVKRWVKTLTVNSFNILAINDNYSTYTRDTIHSLAKTFTTDKADFAFGLHGNNSNIDDYDNKQTLGEYYQNNHAATMVNKSIVDFLALKEVKESIQGSVWTSRLMGLSTDLIYNSDSLFQIKALRLLSKLVTLGCDDSFVFDYVERMREYLQFARDPELFDVKTFMMYGQIFAWFAPGLKDNSIFYQFALRFGAFFIMYENNVILFEIGFRIMCNYLCELGKRGYFEGKDFWETAVVSTDIGSAQIGEDGFIVYPPRKNVVYDYMTPHQSALLHLHEVFLSIVVAKALFLNPIRAFLEQGVDDLSRLRLSTAKKHMVNTGSSSVELDSLAILASYYVASGQKKMSELLESSGMHEELADCVHIGKDQLPKVLIEFLLSGSKTCLATLLILAKQFSLRSAEINWKSRFLKLIKYLSHFNSDVVELVFPVIKDMLLQMCKDENTKTEDVVIINDIQVVAMGVFMSNHRTKPLINIVLERLKIELSIMDVDFTMDGKNICLTEEQDKDFRESKVTVALQELMREFKEFENSLY